MNMIRTATFAAASLLVLGGTAMAQDVDLTETLDARPSFTSGQEAWDKTCARCHTTPGGTQDQSVGPDLSLTPYNEMAIRFFVRNGFNAMPAFPASALDDATLADLATYIAENIYKGDAQ